MSLCLVAFGQFGEAAHLLNQARGVNQESGPRD